MIASNGKSSVFRQTDYGRTPLSDIFRGETRSRLQREGGMSKDAVQPFYTLQLNIEVSFCIIFFETCINNNALKIYRFITESCFG